MTARIFSDAQQKTVRLTLSKPMQAGLYMSLWALILWTVYFTTYPPIHDRVHSLRHHTVAISCH
ncbi:MAG: CbtB-domain containing protein [Scytolyngbya sp. HA4215-MV1]|jgi:hypothetical protein|nr:CbtB-domain containing protein [Scytolyngbya sp. HA4215-MV1]